MIWGKQWDIGTERWKGIRMDGWKEMELSNRRDGEIKINIRDGGIREEDLLQMESDALH